MQLEERYRRTAYDVLELSMTITDPKIYTKPWTSQLKRFRLLPKTGSRLSTDGPACLRISVLPPTKWKNSTDWFATPPGAWSTRAGYWPSTENASSKFPGITGSRE